MPTRKRAIIKKKGFAAAETRRRKEKNDRAYPKRKAIEIAE